VFSHVRFSVTYTYSRDGTSMTYLDSFVGATVTESRSGSSFAASYLASYDPLTLSVTYTVTSITGSSCVSGNCTSLKMSFVPGCSAAALPVASFFPAASGYYILTQNQQLSMMGGYTSVQSNCALVTVSGSTVTYNFTSGATTYTYLDTFVGSSVTETNTAGGTSWAASYVAFVNSATGVVTYTAVNISTNPGYSTCTACVNVTQQFTPSSSCSAASLAAMKAPVVATLFPSGSGLYTLTQDLNLALATGYTSVQTNCATVLISNTANTGMCLGVGPCGGVS